MKTLSLAALAATLLVAPASAQDTAADHHSQVVRYADLDLGTARGVAHLDRRIRAAVRQVCGTVYSFDVEGGNDVRACRAELLDRLSAQRDGAIASAAAAPATRLAERAQ